MDSRGGASNLGAEGLPYVFDAFRLEGRVAGLKGPPARAGCRPAAVDGPPSTRSRGDVVAFP